MSDREQKKADPTADQDPAMKGTLTDKSTQRIRRSDEKRPRLGEENARKATGASGAGGKARLAGSSVDRTTDHAAQEEKDEE